MARSPDAKSGRKTGGEAQHPTVLQPLFATGHGDRELERAGTPGTPVPGECPRLTDTSPLVTSHTGTPGTPGTLPVPAAHLARPSSLVGRSQERRRHYRVQLAASIS